MKPIRLSIENPATLLTELLAAEGALRASKRRPRMAIPNLQNLIVRLSEATLNGTSAPRAKAPRARPAPVQQGSGDGA